MNKNIKHLIRPHFFEFEGYSSAGMESDKSADLIFLNANENAHALEGLEGLNRYPEPQPKALINGYAKLYNVPRENIVATRGADEAITLLTTLFVEPHKDSILIHPPTFDIYAVNARRMPAGIIEVPLIEKDGAFILDKNNIIETTKQTAPKLIYLCSPNNPTGQSTPREEMLEIIKAAQGKAIVIIDETYIEFSKQSSMSEYLAEFPNLIILRTLSKSFALAGQRMGCLITGDPDLAKMIATKVLDVYPLPRSTLASALNVLSPETQKIAQKNIQQILKDRDTLMETFRASPHVNHVFESDANFFLVRMPLAHNFAQACAAQNIVIRDFSKRPRLENCLRISVGTKTENEKLISVLQNF